MIFKYIFFIVFILQMLLWQMPKTRPQLQPRRWPARRRARGVPQPRLHAEQQERVCELVTPGGPRSGREPGVRRVRHAARAGQEAAELRAVQAARPACDVLLQRGLPASGIAGGHEGRARRLICHRVVDIDSRLKFLSQFSRTHARGRQVH